MVSATVPVLSGAAGAGRATKSGLRDFCTRKTPFLQPETGPELPLACNPGRPAAAKHGERSATERRRRATRAPPAGRAARAAAAAPDRGRPKSSTQRPDGRPRRRTARTSCNKRRKRVRTPPSRNGGTSADRTTSTLFGAGNVCSPDGSRAGRVHVRASRASGGPPAMGRGARARSRPAARRPPRDSATASRVTRMASGEVPGGANVEDSSARLRDPCPGPGGGRPTSPSRARRRSIDRPQSSRRDPRPGVAGVRSGVPAGPPGRSRDRASSASPKVPLGIPARALAGPTL